MHETAVSIVRALTSRQQRVAAAESLTGGLLAATLTAVPGASAVFQAGVVAYHPAMKTTLLGVPAGLIESAGVVSQEVADALADGAKQQCGADWALSTTGAAGPEAHGGQQPGTVWVAVARPYGGSVAECHHFDGDRNQVRYRAVDAALVSLAKQMGLATN